MAKTLTPIAAIDAGSNTIHLVVVRPPYEGHDMKTLADEAELVRLGADVTAVGAIGPERTQRAIEALQTQIGMAVALGAVNILGLATEGVRRAANAQTFLARVKAETGLTLQLITGEQEAALAYWGATSGMPQLQGPLGVIDLGGGSLELIIGERSRITWRVSLPLGSGVLRNDLLPSDPPLFREMDRAYQHVKKALHPLKPPLPLGEVVVCGGTAATLANLAHKALRKNPQIVVDDATPISPDAPDATGTAGRRPNFLTMTQLDQVLTTLQRYSAQELCDRYHIKEARARLLAPGCVTLLAAMERLDAQRIWVSKRGIREGAILAHLHSGRNWLNAATTGAGWE